MKYARLSGAPTSFASTPDNAAFSSPTNFSVLVSASADVWASGVFVILMAHRMGAADRAFHFAVLQDGQIQLSVSTDGVNLPAVGTSGLSLVNLLPYWFLATRESATGTINIYVASADPGIVTSPAIGAFTLVATGTGPTGALFNSSTPLQVGAFNTGNGSGRLVGRVHRAQFYSGIYGSGSEALVRDFSPTDAPALSSTSWTAGTGETWTLGAVSLFGVIPVDTDTRWSVRAPVVADLDARWATRAAVQSDVEALWSVRAAVTADVDARWSVRSVVAADLDARWATRAAVSADVGLAWATRALVSADVAALWSIRASVSSDLTALWSVRGAVAADLDARWAARAVMPADLYLRWEVESSRRRLHGGDIQVGRGVGGDVRLGAAAGGSVDLASGA